ncbi:MAG: protease HtpX [Deltaproteobacteria bacterium GWA2_38_16]|nr:MAG: protease HtpX [Deltaproteobacteria bacterium GWA2_38_16]OGQ02863.1 MAG: protease HtpX [Deltaproteobacteria bacterium RIFCSPHIGHO2_02_FULL_38_15]OGQ35118.1 MAG: protease HtpX [Deltaproteobacteria bacterium RIFCSPLOWO2_01_FULL_38_9]HBQ21708.1 protease HtpX [Deltaproteobacteria bacterium]
MSNHFKTTILLTLLSVLFIFIGRALGGQQGMVFAFLFALAMNIGSYWFSDKIVLALYRAKPLEEGHDIHSLVRELAQRAKMPSPKVYWINSYSPNAFATGRNPTHGTVVVSEGLLRILNTEELKGVLAHEMSHIKNRDTLISAIAASIASALVMLANMAKWAAIFGGMRRNNDERQGGGLELLAMAIVAPLAATLIQMAISRSREFQADASGAQMAGGPYGLISALQKIAKGAQQMPMEHATPATSHLFIINPLSGGTLLQLFSTHPALEQRIERLRNYRQYV